MPVRFIRGFSLTECISNPVTRRRFWSSGVKAVTAAPASRGAAASVATAVMAVIGVMFVYSKNNYGQVEKSKNLTWRVKGIILAITTFLRIIDR
jgi:hypothetical protein